MEISTRKVIFLVVSVGVMGALLAAAMFGQAVQQDNVYKYLSVFSEVFSIVSNNYVDEVSSDRLVDGAFAGVTQAVDEFSYYVPPTEMPSYRQYLESTDGLSAGAVMTKRFGYAFVMGVAPGSPAAQAGIKPGDFIEEIDGVATDAMPAWRATAALRGAEGETRDLVVVHAGGTERDEVTLTLTPREELSIEERDYGHVGYLKIPDFREGTAERLSETLTRVRDGKASALIIDVRGNSTGSIDEAILSADLLLAGGTITSVAGRRTEKQVWAADKTTLFDGDILVLTDASSAEGSEVFAAAISGNERGRVVGLTTYGKAIVQKLVELPSGGGLFLTIGHYTRPDLEPIQNGGIRPDVVVERSAWDDIEKKDGEESDRDPILEKALSLLEVEQEEKVAA